MMAGEEYKQHNRNEPKEFHLAILRVLKESPKPISHLIYATNMRYRMLQPTLKLLERSGIILYEENTRMATSDGRLTRHKKFEETWKGAYVITPKGREYLEKLEEFASFGTFVNSQK